MNYATKADAGYVCPVRGCCKKKNRRFTPKGLAMHMIDIHGAKDFTKRLKSKYKAR